MKASFWGRQEFWECKTFLGDGSISFREMKELGKIESFAGAHKTGLTNPSI